METNKVIDVKKIEELVKFYNDKALLREQNLNADQSLANPGKKGSKMDAINKFKNKLKDFVPKYDQIMNDIEKINLSRFILEISKTLCESTIQSKDIILYLNFCSKLHQEYEEFEQGLEADILKTLKSGGESTDESSRANKRRNLLIFAFECYLIGLPVKFKQVFLQMKEILDNKNEDLFFINMNSAVNFVQNFNEEFLGTTSRSLTRAYEQNPDLPKLNKSNDLLSDDKKEVVKKYFASYLDRMINLGKELNAKLKEIEDQKKQTLLHSGKIDDEIENKYTEQRKKYNSVLDKIEIMCDHMNVDPPKFGDEDTFRFDGAESKDKKGGAKSQQDTPQLAEQYDTDADFDLYTNLPDIKEALEEGGRLRKQAQEKDKQGENTATSVELDGSEEQKSSEEAQMQQPQSSSISQTLDYEELYDRIETCDNQTKGDELIKQYCLVNSSSNRKRYIKDICTYRKEYSLYIPNHFRGLAALNKHFKDVSENLLDLLLKEYKYIKDKAEKDKRLRITMYFCEATKFKLIPQNYVLDCLQDCLNAPSGFNIDVMIKILEKTGYYLVHSPEKNDKLRFEMQLKQVNNFRTTAHLSESVLIQLENAYYVCKPPERKELKKVKNLSQLEQYIIFLLFEKLEEDSIAVELSKLPVKECEDFLVVQFLKIVKKGRFSQLNRVGALVTYLNQFYPSLSQKILDSVIELIETGLEENSITERQRRISMIRFFGELYNYTLIELDIIFKVLYFLVEAGNDPSDKLYGGIPDDKDDCFRISLICTLLDTIQQHLKKKKYKNVVDKYLVFFQRYILGKTYIPINVEFHVLDILENLSPDLKKFKTYKEAHDACIKLSKIKEEEEAKEMSELRIKEQKEKEAIQEEEKERTTLKKASRQERELDIEFAQMIKESMKQNTDFGSQSKNVKAPKEKVVEKIDTNSQNVENKKIITMKLRNGGKVVSKEVAVDKSNKLIQKITKQEKERTETMQSVIEATKLLHQSDVKKSEQQAQIVGNEQIKVIKKNHK